MKAVKVIDSQPTFCDCPEPQGSGVEVSVVSSSICGTDLHALPSGLVEGLILGHEFAGHTPDGTAVAVEPFHTCGECHACDGGLPAHCKRAQPLLTGLTLDGGMAESVLVPEASLIELPTGLDVKNANLVETLAVAVRGLSRAKVTASDKVLVIGAGAIGLAAAAWLQARGVEFALQARYPHQQEAAERLGASLTVGEGYDVVIDAVASQASFNEAVDRTLPDGRILVLGSIWEPLAIDTRLCNKELTIIPSVAYKVTQPNRTFVEAAGLLFDNPHIADVLITHRLPLEAASEAFATAADRKSGAIKVTFDLTR